MHVWILDTQDIIDVIVLKGKKVFAEKTFAVDGLRTFCGRNFCGFGQKTQIFLPQTLSSLKVILFCI